MPDGERVKKNGRPAIVEDNRIWKVGELEVTTALISMCIKEDLNQTLTELASRVAVDKCRPLGESLAVLRELESRGRLGYYEDIGMTWVPWEPKTERKRKK